MPVEDWQHRVGNDLWRLPRIDRDDDHTELCKRCKVEGHGHVLAVC